MFIMGVMFSVHIRNVPKTLKSRLSPPQLAFNGKLILGPSQHEQQGFLILISTRGKISEIPS